MELVFGWFIFAILVGAFASSRGRSFFGHFLLALVLSPLIGFIVLLIIGPKRAAVEAEQLSSGEMKRCPDCAELVRSEANKCKHCGRILNEPAAA